MQELERYEELVDSLVHKLTKHFTLSISIRLKVMMVIGYVEHQIEGARRKESVAKMGAFGWGSKQREVAEVLYDV